MKFLKKIYGGLNLTWGKVILFAVIAGVYTGVMALLPVARDTSLEDISIFFECWILFGILIIMNSKSNLDSALKCFVFFLISQPIVYLVQVPFYEEGWKIFGYYRNWIVWTILTLPMGYIGYYMKKDKWWGVLILLPMLVFLASHAMGYLSKAVFWFPRHLLSCLVCLATMIGSVLGIFTDKKARIIGMAANAVLIVGIIVAAIVDPYTYNTTLMIGDGSRGAVFDETYEVSMDPRYGEVKIDYSEGIETYMLDAAFRRAGTTEVVLKAPDGTQTVFEVKIRYDSYDLQKK